MYFCLNGKTNQIHPMAEPITRYVDVDKEYQPEDVCNVDAPALGANDSLQMKELSSSLLAISFHLSDSK
jgi:hypothetical protein